jgi:hypothetical protein
MLVVDPWDWLDPEGELPANHPRVRRRLLAVLRVVEYGSRLRPTERCATLIECRRRPGGHRCTGLWAVERAVNDSLLAFCPVCGTDEMLVHHWQGTKWSHAVR